MYGILSSKRYHTFIKRSSDAASRDADFSRTFDSEALQSPSVRMLYLYLLHLAQDAPHLDPRLRPTTAAELKWVPDTHKRKRSSDQGSGNDESDQSECGDAETVLGNIEDDDAINSEGTTDANGSALQTRAQAAKYVSLGAPQSIGQPISIQTASNRHQKNQAYLQTLGLVARPQLELTSIQIKRSSVVRHLGLPSTFELDPVVPCLFAHHVCTSCGV